MLKSKKTTTNANNNTNNCSPDCTCNEDKLNKDTKFDEMNENKVEKSDRNNVILANALKRAQEGDFDEDIDDAKGRDFLKVYERFTIREVFSLSEGKRFFKLYKEVFYINDPHKYYFDTVEPTVYRRIAGQKEQGDKKWAEAVAKEMNITIIKKA